MAKSQRQEPPMAVGIESQPTVKAVALASEQANGSLPVQIPGSAPLAPLTQPLPNDQITLSWHPTTHGLGFKMANKTADLIKGCEVHVTDIQRWSTANKKFMVVPAYHPKGTFRRMKLAGPSQIFPERDVEFQFIGFTGGGQAIHGADTKSQIAINLPVDEPGMWSVQLVVMAHGLERAQQAFYRLESGKRPELMEMNPAVVDGLISF